MNYLELGDQITEKSTYLCVGLDTDPDRLPRSLQNVSDPVLRFNEAIIQATQQYCVAYKINTAFYEAQGAKGWEYLQLTREMVPKHVFCIADAKRGDIGNTAKQYGRAFFEQMKFDALTVAPYMGEDSVKPFLDFPQAWVILLGLTSNPGSANFQYLSLHADELEELQQAASPNHSSRPEYLYERVIRHSQNWASKSRMMYVVGATQIEGLRNIRQLAPQHFLLVPGIGAQGGSLEEVSRYGLNANGGLLVNASRSIIYASSEADFADAAAQQAQTIQKEMAKYLQQFS